MIYTTLVALCVVLDAKSFPWFPSSLADNINVATIFGIIIAIE